MRKFGRAGRILSAMAAVITLSDTAMAGTTLRIGLAEDPDVLDPTLARTYVGRIVFASMCDKLFDIDAELNIAPQLLGFETSADGKSVAIKLRSGVKFHDGETMDAVAVKASIARHINMQGSFRKPELAALDNRDRRPEYGTAGPQEPLLAADRPARRSRRHDPQSQGRAGTR